MGKQRLDKFISTQTLFTRSEIRKMIFKGQVRVDGEVVLKPDTKIDDEKSEVLVDSTLIKYKKFVYIVMNKPKGILSATNDKNCETVVDLLDDKYSKRNIFPAGRLDKDSTGLVLLTDDGEFAHKITSPKHHIEKSYIVEIDTAVTDEMVEGFKAGVTLADGEKCESALCEKVGDAVARVVLKEGKYHQIKRMFGVFNAGVNSLHRERIGKFTLPDDMKYGEYIEISPENLI